jgi:hypothetical protein
LPNISGKIECRKAAGFAAGFKNPKNPFWTFVENIEIPFGNARLHKMNVVVAMPKLIVRERMIGLIPTGMSSRHAVI